MAVNYMEDGTLAEPAPINAFMKSPSAIIGDGDAMTWRREFGMIFGIPLIDDALELTVKTRALTDG